MPHAHSSGYFYFSKILLKKLTKKDKITGALPLVISLLVESSSLHVFVKENVLTENEPQQPQNLKISRKSPALHA